MYPYLEPISTTVSNSRYSIEYKMPVNLFLFVRNGELEFLNLSKSNISQIKGPKCLKAVEVIKCITNNEL